MSEIKIFKNLVKIAYLNPKYRHELFCLLGVSFKEHNLRMADAGAAVKIKEDADKGIFSGYTLGVLSAFYTNKNRKFKNPNPAGKKEIAMSTLAKYYSERENNREYKKFEGQTISELQKAFGEFYSEFERQQKTNKELKEKDENVEEDEYEGMDEDEIAEAKEREKKMSPAMRKMREKIEQKYKQGEKDRILKAKTGELYDKIFQTLDEIDPFRNMTPEREAEEVEKLYASWEEKFFETKEDGKVYLKNTGLENNEKTRELVRDVLRDNLTDEKIDDMFNETGKHRHGAIGKFLNPMVDSILVKHTMKSYTETLERHSNLLVKTLTLANKGLDKLGMKVDFENPKFIQAYLDYIDEKYSQELDPEVRLSMRKNTKAILGIVKNLSDETGATKLAKEITAQAVEKIQTSDAVQNAVAKTKEFGKKIYENVIKTETQKIEETVTSVVKNQVKDTIVKGIATAVSSITPLDADDMIKAISDPAALNTLKDTLKKKGIEMEHEEISKMFTPILKEIETYRRNGTVEVLENISSKLENLKVPPTTFEDSVLSQAGTVVDLADKANSIYEHTAVRAVRGVLSAFEGDIQGIQKSFSDDLDTLIKKQIAKSVNDHLHKHEAFKDISLDDKDIVDGFGVDKILAPMRTQVHAKIESSTKYALKEVKSIGDSADEKMRSITEPFKEENDALLEYTSGAKGIAGKAVNQYAESADKVINSAEDARKAVEDRFTQMDEKIKEISKGLDATAKEKFDTIAQMLKEKQNEISKDALEYTEKGYSEVFEGVHKTIELGKSALNKALDETKDLSQSAIAKAKEMEEMFSQIEQENDALLEYTSGAKGIAGGVNQYANFMDGVLDSAKDQKEIMRNKIANSLSNHVYDLQEEMRNFAEQHTETVLDSTGGLLQGVASVVTSAVGVPLGVATKIALNKFTNKSFYSQVEKEGGKSAVLHQKMLNHNLLPQEIDDDFRTKAKEIMNDSIPVEEKIKKLRALQYRYDEEAKPVIARALYQLGKRDATGKDIDGYFKQKMEYLKRGSSDEEIDFSTFFVRLADDNEVLSDKDKAEQFKNFIKNKKNNQIPIEILIRTNLDKMDYICNLKSETKKIKNHKNLDSIMEIVSGEKGIDKNTYESSKKQQIENIKKKGKKKKKQ